MTVRDVPCHVSQESVPPMFEHKKLKTVGKGAGWVRMECRRRGMACEKRIGDTWAKKLLCADHETCDICDDRA